MAKIGNGTFLRVRFWPDQAEEVRSMAGQMPGAKSSLVEIAGRYDALP
ncbi:MAG: hypothetical protein JSS04_06065 [Proteobacteria bacterium]|nr:hypothetical protein [Pseudomonadota bacterium]